MHNTVIIGILQMGYSSNKLFFVFLWIKQLIRFQIMAVKNVQGMDLFNPRNQ